MFKIQKSRGEETYKAISYQLGCIFFDAGVIMAWKMVNVQYLWQIITESHNFWYIRVFMLSQGLCKISCNLDNIAVRYELALLQQTQLIQMRKQVSHGSTATPARMSSRINPKQIHNIFKWSHITTQSTPFCTHRWCHLEYAKICGQSVKVKMLLSHQLWRRAKTAERRNFPSPYLAIHPAKLHGCLTYG